MIPRKWVKGTQLHLTKSLHVIEVEKKIHKIFPQTNALSLYLNPSPTKLLRGVLRETTNVSSNHRNSKDSKVQNGWNGISQIIPSGSIISSPVSSVLTRAHKS
ncbi:hypothetical protein TorRG33x02_013180 [Trema orientale]|uniref:Uncharacterized protein n=1 Tax=Trema orientale TaxID=63057 RepID=A0A2P5FZQ7_TREOI|nr:hypothetical protein TorRG33x02_013180 [Trema orientale]